MPQEGQASGLVERTSGHIGQTYVVPWEAEKEVLGTGGAGWTADGVTDGEEGAPGFPVAAGFEAGRSGCVSTGESAEGFAAIGWI